MFITIAARDLSKALGETLSEIENHPELSRLVTLLESLWVAAASADQSAAIHVCIYDGIPDLDGMRSELTAAALPLTWWDEAPAPSP